MQILGGIYETILGIDEQIVYTGKNPTVSIICAKCHKIRLLNLEAYPHFGMSVRIRCECEYSFKMRLERRQYIRKSTKLLGEILIAQKELLRYPIVVRSLSLKGLGFIRNHKLDYQVGDIFRVIVYLKNRSGIYFAGRSSTRVYGNMLVRHLSEWYVGTQFCGLIQKNTLKVD